MTLELNGELVAYGVTMAFTGLRVGRHGGTNERYPDALPGSLPLGLIRTMRAKAAVAEMRGEANEALKAETAITDLLRS